MCLNLTFVILIIGVPWYSENFIIEMLWISIPFIMNGTASWTLLQFWKIYDVTEYFFSASLIPIYLQNLYNVQIIFFNPLHDELNKTTGGGKSPVSLFFPSLYISSICLSAYIDIIHLNSIALMLRRDSFNQ